MAEILPLRNAEFSRARAFYRLGVILTFPARSRSGLRGDDGVVVFAMAAAQVLSDDWGFSCLLWAPVPRIARTPVDLPTHAERLEHCRLAMRHGVAEGFLVYGDAPAAPGDEALALRIVRAGKEYWAKWGSAARAVPPARSAYAGSVRI